MDYESRLERFRSELKRRSIGFAFLQPGADLFYLTGIRRQLPNQTDSNSYGDYILGAYIGAEEGFTLILSPRPWGTFYENEAKGKPYIEEVRMISHAEKPSDVLAEVIKPHLSSLRIAVGDKAWSLSQILLREEFPYARFIPVSEVTAPMRMIKDADEINLMKKAGEITDEVYGSVVEHLKVGLTEYEVASEINYQLAKRGVDYPSFTSAARFTKPGKPRERGMEVGLGKVLEDNCAITFDFGACYQGYCSDFGRTVFVGKPSQEYRRVHNTVMKSQAAAIERMVDGEINATQLDRIARGIIDDAGYGIGFVHRLGHGIGVTVHEPPFLYPPDETVLRKGMCFTVEPSILMKDSWSCRVEDVVMVTEKGGIPFSRYHKELTVI